MNTATLIDCIKEAIESLDVCTGQNSLGELEYKYVSYVDAEALVRALQRIERAEWEAYAFST